ncbi:112_t:CDS:2 [Scutellospora calospora]|uniref:112_t:CDS:1 n=1 Tax=Scutellospora calospora TaxID=85575 RepID=A0ACA9N3Z3_9GLOM|nr:112_t:CDS:2 [Scutellospora calospora]
MKGKGGLWFKQYELPTLIIFDISSFQSFLAILGDSQAMFDGYPIALVDSASECPDGGILGSRARSPEGYVLTHPQQPSMSPQYPPRPRPPSQALQKTQHSHSPPE